MSNSVKQEEIVQKLVVPQRTTSYPGSRDGFIDANFDTLVACLFQMIGCIFFGYAVSDSAYYASPDRSNTGSFFVSYGLFLAIVLCGQFSGGHFNWAVSIGFFIRKEGNFPFYKLISYLIPQTLGFFLGGLLCWGLQGQINAPLESGNSLVQDFFAQLYGTFLFVFFIMLFTSEISPIKSKFGTMALIPFMLFIFRTFAFRTQSLNPTLAIGLGLALGIKNSSIWHLWQYSWVVIGGPLAGGILAPLFFDYFYVRFLKQLKYIESNQ